MEILEKQLSLNGFNMHSAIVILANENVVFGNPSNFAYERKLRSRLCMAVVVTFV